MRVGDVIDYSFTIAGSNPVFEHLTEFSYKTNWGSPVERVHYRLVGPSGVELEQRLVGDAPRFAVEQHGDTTSYTLSLTSVPAVDADDAARVILSNARDWRAIADWAAPMYAAALANSRDVERIAEQIRAKHASREARIGAALVWVQTQVRYLGIEYGSNSHRPSPAQETLERRYGDCKDKAVLLIAILGELGIDAEPALVDSDNDEPLTRSPYRLHAFNHVIVHVDGQSHWLDPTWLYQKGSLGEFSEPDFGHALLVRPGQTTLTRMATRASPSRMEVSKHLELAPDGQVTMAVTTERDGREAEFHRGRLTRRGLKETSEGYFDFYRKRLDGLQLAAGLKVEDRPDNTTATTEQYRFRFAPQTDGENADSLLGADDIQSTLADLQQQLQDGGSFEIDGANEIRENIEVRYPQPLRDDSERERVSNAFFDFDYRFDIDADEQLMQVRYKLKLKEPGGSATAGSSLERDIERVEALLYTKLRYPLQRAGQYTLGPLSLKAMEWAGTATLVFFAITAVVYLYALIEWQLDRRHAPRVGVFYPVRSWKFWSMSFTTFGVYLVFYFYRSFRYSRDQLGRKSWPAVRAVFSGLFLYSLYGHIRQYCEDNGQAKRVGKPVALLLALLFFALSVVSYKVLPMTTTLLACLCVYPAVLWVNRLNQSDPAAIAQHSRVRPRYILLSILSPLMFLFFVPDEYNLLPSSEVVAKWQIWGHQERFMRERKVIADGEEIELFYSGAVFDFRTDGNGLTDKGTFSYWVDEAGDFQHTSLDYSAIRSVKVVHDYPEIPFLGGRIEAVSSEGEELTLWVPKVKNCRTEFILHLRRSLPSKARFRCGAD